MMTAPDIKAQIACEIYVALEQLGADAELLSTSAAGATLSAGDVRRPHPVRPLDPQVAQQIREYPMPRAPACYSAASVPRLLCPSGAQPLDRLRLMAGPSPGSIRAIRREPKKGHVMNSSSI
jgi:hypothetical protein